MGTSQPQQTAPTPQAAEAEPRSGGPITPTPQPGELLGFLTGMTNGTLKGTSAQPTWSLKPDGSPIAQGAFDPTPKSPTWP
jgi:hypothetical protein